MSDESTKMILVVDDEPAVRNYLKLALEDAGFEVMTAVDGSDALEKVTKRKPDLISLDLVMPKHSGAKFNRALKKNPEWAKIPVLIVTGHARDDLGKTDFEELTVSGLGVYLEKPVSPATYVAAIRKMLGMEASEPKENNVGTLRSELSDALQGAGADALKEALEMLKNKGK